MTVRSKVRRKTISSDDSPGAARRWVALYAGERANRFDLSADLRLAEVVEEGLPTTAVDTALNSGILDSDDVHRLVASKRTLQRRRNTKRLSREESNNLARVVRAVARAEDALGDPAKAERWMRAPNRALDGRRPVDLLGSDGGTRAVERVLGRIEHGVYS